MHKYTLKRDIQDTRDFKLSRVLAPLPKVKLPASVDPRTSYPPVWDQGTLGSCTSNAGSTARAMLAKDKNLVFSRLFLYYKERELMGTIEEDSGASMRDICKALSKFGICHESLMPYDISKFTNPPSEQALVDALEHKVISYHSLTTIDDIKANVALRQQPVLIGMMIYESFESEAVAKTGIAPLPGSNEKSLGGHAVLIVGYKTIKNVPYFIVRNSWGSKWGDKGYFYLPFEFVTRKLAFDSWTLV